MVRLKQKQSSVSHNIEEASEVQRHRNRLDRSNCSVLESLNDEIAEGEDSIPSESL